MVKVVLLVFAQVLLIQTISGQFVGSRLLAAPIGFANDVYEGFLSAAAALPYLETEVLLESLPNNDAGDIPLSGSSRTYSLSEGSAFRDGIFRKGYRPRNYDRSSSFAEAYAVTETDQDW